MAAHTKKAGAPHKSGAEPTGKRATPVAQKASPSGSAGSAIKKAPSPRARSVPPATPAESEPSWTFLTNHAHVLLCIARDPETRIRDLATQVGITERAVQRVLSELEVAGYVSHERTGRRNTYRVQSNMPLRHPVERHRKIASLLALVRGDRDS